MIRAGKCILATTLLVAVLVFVGLMGSSQLTASWGGDPAPNKSKNVQSFVFDSFEDPNGWRADFSLFAAKKYSQEAKQYVLDTSKCSWTNVVGKPWGVEQETATNRCLSVRATFDRKGYNWIEVSPVRKDANGTLAAHPLPMKGRVEYIDVWVWGANFNYRLELHLIDYLGHKHILDAGWLSYIGWKSIRLQVPPHVPQQEKHIPSQRILSFEKFVILSHPGERADNFYIYFDRMQIQTDIFRDRFDGDDLVDSGYESGWMPKPEVMD